MVQMARELAGEYLASELPRRWSHVQAVGGKAGQIGHILAPADAEVLAAAAWLHDIGYASKLAHTGFHPLDGARWLRDIGFNKRVAALVAHHSCALMEADERGLADALSAEFSYEESPTADALWYCDMTTGPDGQTFLFTYRLAEITSRYGEGHLVTRFIRRAEPQIRAAVERTQHLLDAAGVVQPM
jgi:putative nucleotidyltransferase with HDIG domain